MAKSPSATALVYESATGSIEQLTYAQLDEQANQLARYLMSRQIGPDQIVAILLERSPQMIVAMLGILKAGAAYLPLDPEYPSERLEFMLSDSGALALISDDVQLAKLGSSLAIPAVIDLLAQAAKLKTYSAAPIQDSELVAPLLPLNLAYLIYTSGTVSYTHLRAHET